MSEDPRERLQATYERLAVESDPARRVGWPARWMQWLTFEMLADVADLNGRSVLDAGCGLGDLYAHLRADGWQGAYFGVDVVPALIEEARQRHPDAVFIVADVLSDDLPACDYALAGGLFDYRLPDSAARLRRALARLFERAQRGLAWTIFLEPGDPETCYSEPPAKLLAVCHRLTPWVVMRTDANLNLGTFYLYKRTHFVDANVERLIGRLVLDAEARDAMAAAPGALAEEYGLSAQRASFLARLFWQEEPPH